MLSLGVPSTGWRGQFLGLGLSRGVVHHQDPFYFDHRLVPRWHVLLNRGGSLLAVALTSARRGIVMESPQK
jgi:hypothetical protein